MKKIPTLFVRDFDGTPPGRYVTREVTPGCEWVLAGEGVATRKVDGTCVMIDNQGDVWARREVKPGKAPPPGWVEVDHDEVTGKRVGWEPAGQSSFAKLIAEAVSGGTPEPGTYELLGPKVNGNPEGEPDHRMTRHGALTCDLTAESEYAPPPLSFDGLRDYLLARSWEGIVWHHPDGRMAKLKRRDFREPS